MHELNIRVRDAKETNEHIREEGAIPAVFYGPKEENTPIVISASEFTKIWKDVGGSAIILLKGVGEEKEVLIHDVQKHPVKNNPIHADFYCIERGKKLTISIPLVFIGEAPVEDEDGIVVKVMHEMEVEARPRDIPQEIEIDLSVLTELNSHITIADVPLPEGVEAMHEAEDTVVSVTQAREEPEEEEERDISDVEIEGEKKEESEDGDEQQDAGDAENKGE